ncbi:MAG: DUF4926 domain-containing protein [Coleofasciculaceae cyanobacterium RL_1_1]|nr:DUF4926 domain-containing protein [Coleofasciculaceae cyanobacterium RL_1_1]
MTHQTPELFDIIRCERDFPELGLLEADEGAIIECHPGEAYEVEFSDSDGITQIMTVISRRNSVLSWVPCEGIWLLHDLSQRLKEVFDLIEKQGKTFISACLSADALEDELDIFLDVWSETLIQRYSSQEEMLGMSSREYYLWQNNPKILPWIFRAHRNGITLDSEIQLEPQPLVARAEEPEEVSKLEKWLESLDF